MEGASTEWITALGERRTDFGQRDPELLIFRTGARDHGHIVRRERQAAAVEDGAAWNPARDVQHPRVVFVTSATIRLHAEMRADDVGVRMDDLNLDEHG